LTKTKENRVATFEIFIVPFRVFQIWFFKYLYR